jgi:hypothetical protein
MHGISVYLLNLDNLKSILVAVGDISPNWYNIRNNHTRGVQQGE